jgi:hypothetical protein
MTSGLPSTTDLSKCAGESVSCQTLTSQPNQLLDLKWNTNGRRPKGGGRPPCAAEVARPRDDKMIERRRL